MPIRQTCCKLALETFALLRSPAMSTRRGFRKFLAASAIVNSLKVCDKREVYNIAGGVSWQMTGVEYIDRFYSALDVEVEPIFSEEYTAVDWYDTEKSAPLGYQRTSFNQLERKLEVLGEELGLR